MNAIIAGVSPYNQKMGVTCLCSNKVGDPVIEQRKTLKRFQTDKDGNLRFIYIYTHTRGGTQKKPETYGDPSALVCRLASSSEVVVPRSKFFC